MLSEVRYLSAVIMSKNRGSGCACVAKVCAALVFFVAVDAQFLRALPSRARELRRRGHGAICPHARASSKPDVAAYPKMRVGLVQGGRLIIIQVSLGLPEPRENIR